MGWDDEEFPVKETLASKRETAAQRAKELAHELGRDLTPPISRGVKIAKTFWGQAWNYNLDRYQVYEHRLPRGRSCLKNGLVLDLQVRLGEVHAFVSGRDLYEVRVKVKPIDDERWQSLKTACTGQIASLVSLLQGKLPAPVMEKVTEEGVGLFPEPEDIRFICTCPDEADMCEHSAAVAYGFGARLDQHPDMLFTLRGVDHLELLEDASERLETHAADSAASSTLEGDLGSLFGIELDSSPSHTGGKPQV